MAPVGYGQCKALRREWRVEGERSGYLPFWFPPHPVPSGLLVVAKFLCPKLHHWCSQLHDSLSSIHSCFPLNLQELSLASRVPHPPLMVSHKPACTFMRHPSCHPSHTLFPVGAPVDTLYVHHVPLQRCICPNMLSLLTLRLVSHFSLQMQVSLA